MHPAAQRSPVGCIASIQFSPPKVKSPVALRKADGPQLTTVSTPAPRALQATEPICHPTNLTTCEQSAIVS